MRVRLLLSLPATMLVIAACSGAGSEPIPTAAGLDIRGASNTPCTVIVARGGLEIRWDVGAPIPAVPDTSLADRQPIGSCQSADASTVSVTTTTSPAPAGVQATRSSTELCFSQNGSLMGAFGFDANSGDCPVTLTLICAGFTFYDRAPWTVCQLFG